MLRQPRHAPKWRQRASTNASHQLNWFCLHTKPRREARAAQHLVSQLDIETYFPRISERRIYRRAPREMVEPLFPRYLFCRVDAASQLRAVRYAPDVIDVVRTGGEPVVVSERLVTQLKCWTGDSEILRIQNVFLPGERVKITGGPMLGLEAIVLESKSQGERVAILLSILGRDAHLTISRLHLAKAG